MQPIGTAQHTATNHEPVFSSILSDQVTLTPAAHEQLQALVASEDEVVGLRIFVTGGGCSGMTYGMTFATEAYEHDTVLQQGDLKVYVDAIALSFLEGVEIDFQELDTGASFVFRNVFQAVGGGGACGGCGNALG